MPNSPDTLEFHQFAPWLKEIIAASSDPFVRDCETPLKLFREREATLPKQYGWRHLPPQALKAKLIRAQDIREFNRLYWKDLLADVEAYSITTVYRSRELINPTIRALNVREITPAAVLSRSLLELSAKFITNADVVSANLATKDASKFKTSKIISTELQKKLEQILYGTRFPGLLNAEVGFPEPEWIGHTLKAVAKRPAAAELYKHYEFLCEFAHPNFLGNLSFWAHEENMESDGSVLRVLTRAPTDESLRLPVAVVLWTLAWSAAVVHNGVSMLSNSIKQVLDMIE